VGSARLGQSEGASQAHGNLSPWSVLGPHGIRNRWSSAGTSGHHRRISIAGQRPITIATLDREAARRWVRIPPDGGRVCTSTNETGVSLNEPRDRHSRSAYAGTGVLAVLTFKAASEVDLPVLEAPPSLPVLLDTE
jgi:hypothetical protein